jgi:hypothetical protein
MSPSSSNESPPYDTYSAAQSDHGQGPPRKKMRKGTKSCLECRRRKIKCTFEPGRTAICNECYARGSTCVDQEHGDLQTYVQTAASEQSSYSLRERVTQLEDLVKQVLHKIPDKEDAGSHGMQSRQLENDSVDAQAAEVLKSIKQKVGSHPSTLLEESIVLPGGFREYAPALTLFDNAVIARKEAPPAVSRAQYNKSKALVAALNQLLPCPADLDIILEAGKDWWQIWKKMFPEISDHRCQNLKEAVSHSLRSEKPAEVAKIMLCIANSVYQMPSGFDWSKLQLKESPEDLMERYINTVNRLIVGDDEIAATVDGIECIVLEAKYHINMGRPRRAWLLMHRAIAFAQLLGLHRLSSRKPENPDGEYVRQVSIWCHLFAGDKFLSLMLGLPYSVQEQYCTQFVPGPMGSILTGATEGETYLARMIPIITKTVDRNQSPIPLPYSATLRIDQDLEELYNHVQTPGWWTTSRFPGSTLEDHFDRLQAQFYHHQIRVFLHMPFMLKSSADKGYQYSHTAALDSARQMIKYYEALRIETKVGPFICKIIDFQAFTAAMLLLLNLCGYAQQSRGALVMQPDLDQDQQDSALIDVTINLLRDASKEAGGIVAQQSYKALEMVAQIRHGCDEKSMEECERESCQISIPYFGTVTMAPGKHFVIPKQGTYPKPGEPRKTNSALSGSGMNMNTGLPTPPSLPSSSTQPSPLSASMDRVLDSSCPMPNINPRQPFGATDWIAPGMGSSSYDDVMTRDQDPFVMFDSFMALPGQGQDFPGSTESSGFTPTAFGQGQMFDPVAQGFPWANGGGDLDQSWNWFTGVEGMPGGQ